MEILRKNRRGQIEFSPALFILFFIVLAFSFILTSLIINKFSVLFMGGLSNLSINGVNESIAIGEEIFLRFNNLADYIVLSAFIINLIFLLLSAWFIRTHPFFVSIYLIISFITFLFIPNILNYLFNLLVDASLRIDYSNINVLFPKTFFILSNLPIIYLFVLFLYGIVLYNPFKR